MLAALWVPCDDGTREAISDGSRRKDLMEHRIHVAAHVRLPKGAAADIIAAIETQPGVRRVPVELPDMR